MDAKAKDKLIMAIVVMLVVAQMVAMAVCVYLANTGAITQEAFLMASSATSSAMFVVIIVYALYIYKNRPSESTEEYQRFAERQEKGPKDKE